MPRVERLSQSNARKSKYPFNAMLILFALLVMTLSCKEDEEVKQVALVADYLPTRLGNEWIYLNEVSGYTNSSTEKWSMGGDRFNLYELLPTGEERYLGYRALLEIDNLFEISDLAGTFVSVRYLDVQDQDWVQIAADEYSRQRWIKSGIVNLETSFGTVDCILTKTIMPGYFDKSIQYMYFGKKIGICLIEEYSSYTDPSGGEKTDLISKKTLVEYKLQ